MIKRSFTFLGFLLFSFFLTSCKKSEQASHRELIVGMSADYPPFAYFNNGEITGFEVELIQQLGKQLGYKVLIKDMPFDSLIGALQAKRIDLVISAMSATDERKKSIDFSDDYHLSKPVILVEKSSQFTSFKQLYDQVLGVQMGTIYESELKKIQEINTKLKIHSLNKVPDLLQDLWLKRISGIVVGDIEAKTLVRKYPQLTCVDSKQSITAYAIAFPKNSSLKATINKALKDFMNTKKFEKIRSHYFN